MEIHAQVWVKVEPPKGALEASEPVDIRLGGSYNAIAALLRQLKWDENMAQELKLN